MTEAPEIPGDDEALADSYGETLIKVAAQSISSAIGIDGGRCEMSAAAFPEPLRQPRATFVTLHMDRTLRGCIGTVAAHRPLVEDVAWNAYAAAFRDTRFDPVDARELQRISASISILSPTSRIEAASREDVLLRLRPGVDGVVFQDERRRAVFLPQVWEHLPEPAQFWDSLLLKAGLPHDHWSPSAVVEIFHVTSIPETPLSAPS